MKVGLTSEPRIVVAVSHDFPSRYILARSGWCELDDGQARSALVLYMAERAIGHSDKFTTQDVFCVEIGQKENEIRHFDEPLRPKLFELFDHELNPDNDRKLKAGK